jgi:hypothetical protein
VDLREALGDIARNNTFFHLDCDLGISIEQMERAAKLHDYTEKTLLWVSYPCGIDCYSEREAFQKDTRGYNGVLYHGFDMQSDRKLAYTVDVSGIKDGRVFGSLYETDIREYAENVRINAVVSNCIRIYVDDPHGNGEQIVMPKDEFNRRYPLDLVKMAYYRHEPENPDLLKSVMDDMWNKSREGNYESCKLWQHMDKLSVSRTEFYSNQIIDDMSKLREPNGADRQFFCTSLNSYIATAFQPEQLSRILDALPYKNAEFSIKKGQRYMQVVVPRDEIIQERRQKQGKLLIEKDGKTIPVTVPPNEKREAVEKSSLLASLEVNEQKSKEQFGQKVEPGKEKVKKSKREEI